MPKSTGHKLSNINDYYVYSEYQVELKEAISGHSKSPLMWELKYWHKAIQFYNDK